MAQRTGSRAIFDVSLLGADALRSALRKAAPAAQVRDIKISAPALLDPSLAQLLQETGVQNLWVECHPHFFRGDFSVFLQRLRGLAEDYNFFPIIGDLDLLAALLTDSPDIGRVVLKGCEASGFVSGETTLALYSAVKEMLHNLSQSMEIFIWGSVATPEAAAAFLVTGASGIVFESVHWLTDLVGVDDRQQRQLANLRLDSTDLVGLDLQVPCRLFNKGNSVAFKELKQFESSLCGAEISGESRRSFADRVNAGIIHPLASHFTPGETIPLGVETAFATSFVKRFGTRTEEAVNGFLDETQRLCRLAEGKKDFFVNSPLAEEMGTRYPFIQGAMSCISDVPEFALRVAEAGGLPTIALGLMDAQTLERRLQRLPEVMGEHPYAVNIVSLAENPHRETHLAWIKKHRPRFVVIAGGDLSPLKELLECGIEVIYIAPDEALLQLALEAGVRYVIIEGYEAGGHVGRHSTLTLAQRVSDLKRLKPSLFQDCRIVLAGGICNRESAFIAAMLGADGVQMGTAYLASREIVATGALTPLYQRMILESPPGGTVVSGQATGLRVRSLRTPRADAVLSLEREFAAGHQDERSFRTKIEEMSAGSLFAAARGIDKFSEAPLDEQACLERGQFMSGACAGVISTVLDLPAFHRELGAGRLLLHQPVVGSINTTTETPSSQVHRKLKPVPTRGGVPERVAITGMSIVNTLGKSPEEVWAASQALKSGITLVPSSRWDHAFFYDPRPQVVDKTYCKVGAFLDFSVSRSDLGIPPHDFRTMTGATRLTLWLADRAIRASGILDSTIPRERIGVLISQNSGEAAGTLTNMIIRAHIHDFLAAVNRAVPLTPEQQNAIEREVKAGRMAPDDTTLLGRLNCAAAGFICNRYGFMGPSYAVSAACATSLVALYSAIQMIRNNIIDAAIIGGAEENLTHLHFLEFSALGALYGLSGQERPAHEASRPFDAERGGMVLGEGGGMIVIERESLARARGVPIHAFVTSMGASNNHLGMVESSNLTQQMAIRASFRGMPYGPDAVDLVECHATSTRQGDVEEARALKGIFNSSRRTVLTSFKSQIGHTLGASGINSLIRGVTAMKAGVFPPTLNYNHPDPEIGLEGSNLLVTPEPLTWKGRADQPRRFQVNAFGFGGSNYVVQVEQAMDEAGTVLVATDRELGLDDEKEGGTSTLRGVSFFRTGIDGHNCRLAVVAQSDAEARTVIDSSAALAEGKVVSPRTLRSLAQQGIFLRREDLPVLPLAFVFPGQGAQYAGMGQELYDSFPVIREWMDQAAAAADFDLLRLLFHDREENLQKTRWQQPAMFAMEHAMARYLLSLGIHPVAMAGHSLGELTALCLAGVYSPEDGFRIVNKRALCMDKAATMHVDPGVMAAVDVPPDLLQEIIRGQGDVHIGNINSPNQIVLSGSTEAVKDLCIRIKGMGYRATLLRVSMAFHSPVMKVIHDELEEFIAAIPFHSPRIPVISNKTRAPYPPDPGEIRRILMAHLESTVHWMDNVQTLWNDYGVRLFVEVGPGDVLSNLIGDTLPEAACIRTCLPGAEGLTCRTALAQLFVHDHLQVEGEPMVVSLPASGRSAPEQTAPAPAASPAHQDHIEALIQIIMEATGFDREEIQPDMDLRRDLSIRSSRLPIIMDSAERYFGITIELEDFIGLRTVKDIAQKISALVAGKEDTGLPPTARAVDSGPPIPDGQVAAPALTGSSAHQAAHTEALIQIIMEATGFDREEIQPDMDLRRDLSIRSSRLPIIMDAAERQFGITIELEDFIGLRTVKDIAQKISAIVAGKEGVSLLPAAEAAAADPARDEIPRSAEDAASLKRLVFKSVPLELSASAPIQVSQGEAVVFLSMDRDDHIAQNVGDILRSEYGVDTFPLLCMQAEGAGPEGCAILTDEGACQVAERISGLPPLAGLVITLPAGWSGKFRSMADVSRFVRGLFLPLKTFLQAPARKFVLLIHCREDAETPGRLAAEGLLGMFLSAAQEYASVQFRTLEIEKNTDLRAALRDGLDRGYPMVEMAHRAGRVFTSEGRIAPLLFSDFANIGLSTGEVVVMSGGATGIGAHLARSLVPFKPRLVFLGRTSVDPVGGVDIPADDGRVAEIARTLADLRSLGIEATYHACDVADPVAVRVVMAEVADRYGEVRGIIHGAGVLRDGFLSHMTPDDFSMVTDSKFLGAWNLFQAAGKAGLRFFVGLSSVAAIQGNPGQVNYAAANRMMSALIRDLRQQNDAIRFKALVLPPIEGAGMAEDKDIRELMRRKGVGYIHVNELAGLFCRELFASPDNDDWVMFMRTLPAVKTAKINDQPPPSPNGELAGSFAAFRPEDFPLIEGVSSLDIRWEQLEACRTFSREKDLWLEDHSPLPFVKHPLVSAAMFVETFMEAARLLYPYLQVRGLRQVRFMDMIQCPPGVPRPARISCRPVSTVLPEVVCEVTLAAREISPAGRLTDRFTPHCEGQVILAGVDGGEEYPGGFPDFPVRLDELRTGPMKKEKVLEWYKERSGLAGRYRVLEFLDGAGPGVIRGQTVYRQTDDFANLPGAQYQYSPYLFEALLQLAAFYGVAMEMPEQRSMIPMEIGEMWFSRKCREGERITLEARMRSQNEQGFSWDARGLDEQGRTIMQVANMRMQWVSD
ncbi:MAG: SDR family NAD(P)-dependent oxidoreductase [Desulfobulbaceae bacterium]